MAPLCFGAEMHHACKEAFADTGYLIILRKVRLNYCSIWNQRVGDEFF